MEKSLFFVESFALGLHMLFGVLALTRLGIDDLCPNFSELPKSHFLRPSRTDKHKHPRPGGEFSVILQDHSSNGPLKFAGSNNFPCKTLQTHRGVNNFIPSDGPDTRLRYRNVTAIFPPPCNIGGLCWDTFSGTARGKAHYKIQLSKYATNVNTLRSLKRMFCKVADRSLQYALSFEAESLFHLSSVCTTANLASNCFSFGFYATGLFVQTEKLNHK